MQIPRCDINNLRNGGTANHLLGINKSKYRLDFEGETAPISIQIAGSSALELVESAKKAAKFSVHIIDINTWVVLPKKVLIKQQALH